MEQFDNDQLDIIWFDRVCKAHLSGHLDVLKNLILRYQLDG